MLLAQSTLARFLIVENDIETIIHRNLKVKAQIVLQFLHYLLLNANLLSTLLTPSTSLLLSYVGL